MNIKTYLTILACVCMISPHATANENDNAQSENRSSIEDIFANDQDGLVGDMDNGFQYKLAGDAEEEGALKLFVKNTASRYDLNDPNADAFSRISPAAGIQLHFDF